MVVTTVLTVYPDLAHRLGQCIVVGEERATVAVSAEWLRGKERRRPDERQRTRAPAVLRRAEALRRVVDHGQPVAGRDRVDRCKVSALTIQRHRHDGPRTRRDGRLEERRIEVPGPPVDVYEHRRRPGERDHFARCDERERRRDHLVATTNAERHERDQERVRAARGRDAVSRAGIARKRRLELGDLGAQDELAMVQHLGHARVDRRLDASVLGLQIDEIHGGHLGGATVYTLARRI